MEPAGEIGLRCRRRCGDRMDKLKRERLDAELKYVYWWMRGCGVEWVSRKRAFQVVNNYRQYPCEISAAQMTKHD
eukprot:5459615-Pleurochrysis_carterae.AAC.1